jgi:pyruvate formate lyase activating enzyme
VVLGGAVVEEEFRRLSVREAQQTPLGRVLSEMAREGELYRRLDGGKVECFACGHRCVIFEGLAGICRVRFNRGGRLYVPWGYVGALQLDPIEKKPFFHAYPGARTLSFGMLGCDLHCPYCQNWQLSQTLRDPVATRLADFTPLTPEEFVQLAVRHGAKVLASTYNEPLITSEWAVALFREGKKRGLVGSYVSNGNATPEVLDYLRPYVDLYKVDLKSMREGSYRVLGGRLQTVLDTIRGAWERGFWVEVVTLVVPGFNDNEGELREAAAFLASVSPFLPWHVTAFHSDYRMQDTPNTPPEALLRAVRAGEEAGLRYVYAGNLPGRVGRYESTYCHGCGALLVERRGFAVLRNRLASTRGICPDCGVRIPGIWG